MAKIKTENIHNFIHNNKITNEYSRFPGSLTEHL